MNKKKSLIYVWKKASNIYIRYLTMLWACSKKLRIRNCQMIVGSVRVLFITWINNPNATPYTAISRLWLNYNLTILINSAFAKDYSIYSMLEMLLSLKFWYEYCKSDLLLTYMSLVISLYDQTIILFSHYPCLRDSMY